MGTEDLGETRGAPLGAAEKVESLCGEVIEEVGTDERGDTLGGTVVVVAVLGGGEPGSRSALFVIFPFGDIEDDDEAIGLIGGTVWALLTVCGIFLGETNGFPELVGVVVGASVVGVGEIGVVGEEREET